MVRTVSGGIGLGGRRGAAGCLQVRAAWAAAAAGRRPAVAGAAAAPYLQALDGVRRLASPYLEVSDFEAAGCMDLVLDFDAAAVAGPPELAGAAGSDLRARWLACLMREAYKQHSDWLRGAARGPTRRQMPGVSRMHWIVDDTAEARARLIDAAQRQSITVQVDGVNYRIPASVALGGLLPDQHQLLLTGMDARWCRQGAVRALLAVAGYTAEQGVTVVHESAGRVACLPGEPYGVPALDHVVAVVRVPPACAGLPDLPQFISDEYGELRIEVRSRVVPCDLLVVRRAPPPPPPPPPPRLQDPLPANPGVRPEMAGVYAAAGITPGVCAAAAAPVADVAGGAALPPGARAGIGFVRAGTGVGGQGAGPSGSAGGGRYGAPATAAAAGAAEAALAGAAGNVAAFAGAAGAGGMAAAAPALPPAAAAAGAQPAGDVDMAEAGAELAVAAAFAAAAAPASAAAAGAAGPHAGVAAAAPAVPPAAAGAAPQPTGDVDMAEAGAGVADEADAGAAGGAGAGEVTWPEDVCMLPAQRLEVPPLDEPGFDAACMLVEDSTNAPHDVVVEIVMDARRKAAEVYDQARHVARPTDLPRAFRVTLHALAEAHLGVQGAAGLQVAERWDEEWPPLPSAAAVEAAAAGTATGGSRAPLGLGSALGAAAAPRASPARRPPGPSTPASGTGPSGAVADGSGEIRRSARLQRPAATPTSQSWLGLQAGAMGRQPRAAPPASAPRRGADRGAGRP